MIRFINKAITQSEQQKQKDKNKMYYQSQLRNLQKQAQLQRKLAQVTIAEDLITSRRQQSMRRSRGLARSRRQQDEQTSVHLKRSRIQAQLQASSVSTTAILNRSRIESALEVRQRNHELNTQRQRSLIQEQYYEAARLKAQQEMYLERNREIELSYIQQANTRDELYRRIRLEQEERLEYERKQRETRRILLQEEARRRQLIQREIAREELLRRPYYYY